MSPQVFQTFARYNSWMNENIYSGCAKIPDDQRKKDMGAFFKSVHGTLMKQCGIDPGPTDLPAMPTAA